MCFAFVGPDGQSEPAKRTGLIRALDRLCSLDQEVPRTIQLRANALGQSLIEIALALPERERTAACFATGRMEFAGMRHNLCSLGI